MLREDYRNTGEKEGHEPHLYKSPCRGNFLCLDTSRKLSFCNKITDLIRQAATVAHPSCQAAKLSTCCLLTLSSFSCHTAPKVQHTQKSGSNSRPRPIQTRIQTRSRPQPAPCISVLKLVIVSFPSFLQAVDSRSMKFGTHADRYQERLKSS